MSDSEWHPLFPPKEEDDDPDASPPEIQEIHVQRKENGRLYTAPRVFFPNELTSLPALYAEFGGGEYILLARNSRKQITGRSMFSIPGNSKPMFDDGPQAQQKPAQTQPANQMMAMMGPDGGGIMGLVMMMMQQMMQSQQAASQQQSQMMMAFIQTMASGNQAQIQAAQEAMNRQAERDARDKESQMAMLVKLTEARNPGDSTSGEASFFKGVEFMKHFAQQNFTQQIEALKSSGKGKDFDWEALLESGMQALQMFGAYKDLAGQGLPSAVPPVTEVVQ